MNWCVEPKILGGGMMAAGTALLNLVGNKVAWWAGLTCLVIGPIMLSMRRRNSKQKD